MKDFGDAMARRVVDRTKDLIRQGCIDMATAMIGDMRTKIVQVADELKTRGMEEKASGMMIAVEIMDGYKRDHIEALK